MLKNNPYMKAYLNTIIKEDTNNIEKYQQIADEIGGVYIPETNTIDCKGNKVKFKNNWINENGTFDFKLINTSNDWSKMFYNCTNLTHLPEDFIIFNNVTDCHEMFRDCTSLIYLPDNFTIPKNVINCCSMFRCCDSLTHLSNNFNIPESVVNCNNMFSFCKKLIQLPDNFTIPNSVIYCNFMFYLCKSLTHLPNKFYIPADAECIDIFYGCIKLENKDLNAYMMWEI